MEFCVNHPGCEGFIGRWQKKSLYTSTIALWRKIFPTDVWSGVYQFDPPTVMEPDYIRFENGSVVHLLPLQLHEDKLRGGNFNFGFIDQMEECPQKVWTQAVSSVREEPLYCVDEEGQKAIYDGPSIRFVLSTINKTVKGNWYSYKRLFVDKKGILPCDVHKYRLIENAWDENKEAVASGYYNDLKANATSDAQVAFEVYGEDPSEFGLVFPEWSEHTNVRSFEFEELQSPAFYIGYDEGWNPAPSAFVFLAITPDGKIWVRADYSAARRTIRDHEAILVEMAQRLKFPLNRDHCRMVGDCTILGKRDGYGVSIAEQWGSAWNWEGGTRDEHGSLSLMRTLMQVDESGDTRIIIHPDCRQLIEEISEAEYDPEKPGRMLERCTVHTLDACRYAIAASRTPVLIQPAPDLTGKWAWDRVRKQVMLAKKGRSWLAPSRNEADIPLLAPRRDRS